ncbi:MAG: hypothetical protein ACRDTT_28185, partial [Pseudonocardiaceae bacterium]
MRSSGSSQSGSSKVARRSRGGWATSWRRGSRLAGRAPLQFQQGRDASAFAKDNAEQRLTRPDGRKRNLFIRIAERPFDDNGRLLAYVAPDYSAAERRTLTRRERATFNLDLVA